MKREGTHRPLAVVCTPLVALLALLVFALAGCDQSGKTVSLRFKYEPGMKCSYKLTKKSRSRMIQADSVIWKETRNTTRLINDSVCNLTSDSTAEIAEFSETSYGLIVRNDSTINDTSVYRSSVVLRLSPNGKVVGFEFPGQDNQESLDYYRDLYQQGYPVFPPGELHQGHTWTQTTSVKLNDGPSEASTTYRIKSFVRERGFDCAVITYKGNLAIPIESDGQDSVRINGVNRTEFTGLMYFAYRDGFVVSTRNRWTVDGTRVKSLHGKPLHEYRVQFEGDDSLELLERITGGGES